jgi:hypothetical protein
MSAPKNLKTIPRLVQSMVIAAAFALPSVSAFSESADAVTIKSDQTIDHPGRDSVYAPTPSIVATPPENPQSFGRAGGFVGADRSTLSASPASQPSPTVKTGESEAAHIAHAQTNPEVQPADAPALPSQTGTVHEGDRFGDPNGAHGHGQAVQ